jgi:hypothetical protein
MRRIALIACLAALVVPAAGAVAAPELRVVTRTPLVVSGTHFRSHERVTVMSGTAKAVVRTGPAGSFRANLGSVLADRCSYGIVAVGARGDRAVLPVRAMCAPASTP